VFKRQDLEVLGLAHDEIQKAAGSLTHVEVCKTDVKARIYRIRAREHLKKGRQQLRALRDYVQREQR